jgi:hypothetical protein
MSISATTVVEVWEELYRRHQRTGAFQEQLLQLVADQADAPLRTGSSTGFAWTWSKAIDYAENEDLGFVHYPYPAYFNKDRAVASFDRRVSVLQGAHKTKQDLNPIRILPTETTSGRARYPRIPIHLARVLESNASQSP